MRETLFPRLCRDSVKDLVAFVRVLDPNKRLGILQNVYYTRLITANRTNAATRVQNSLTRAITFANGVKYRTMTLGHHQPTRRIQSITSLLMKTPTSIRHTSRLKRKVHNAHRDLLADNNCTRSRKLRRSYHPLVTGETRQILCKSGQDICHIAVFFPMTQTLVNAHLHHIAVDLARLRHDLLRALQLNLPTAHHNFHRQLSQPHPRDLRRDRHQRHLASLLLVRSLETPFHLHPTFPLPGPPTFRPM